MLPPSSNYPGDIMDMDSEIERVAQQYRDEGYAVEPRPGADRLPAFAANFAVDILAVRGIERVLVKVKRQRSDLEADPAIPQQAEITNRQPGWRYDLVVLNAGDPIQRITRDAREPSIDEIEQSLSHAESLIRAGDLRAGLVFGWAALEASMRYVASSVELYMPKATPAELLRTLYGNGVLTRAEFDLLKRGFRFRTEIVHGLVSTDFAADLVLGVTAISRSLLTGEPDPRSAAG